MADGTGLRPLTAKEGRLLGFLQDAERLHRETALLLGDLRGKYDADPTAYGRIGNLAADAERRAWGLGEALYAIFGLAAEIDAEIYDRAQAQKESA